jgi:hypothetical protein
VVVALVLVLWLLALVVLVGEVVQPGPFRVKFPLRPTATSLTGESPVLFTRMVRVVEFPKTERARRVAVTLPLAWSRSSLSLVLIGCFDPTSLLWPPTSACVLRIPTADGIIWYPVGVSTTVGLSSTRRAFVPFRGDDFARVTCSVLAPVASVTAETVPLTAMLNPVTVKLSE